MEILGLLDTLESMILDSGKIPFTRKAVIDEEKILGVIDKMRLVAQGGASIAKEAIASKAGQRLEAVRADQADAESVKAAMPGRSPDEVKSVEVLQQAYQMAKEIREGADNYADQVLANLEATSTRILRTIKAGRERLVKSA